MCCLSAILFLARASLSKRSLDRCGLIDRGVLTSSGDFVRVLKHSYKKYIELAER